MISTTITYPRKETLLISVLVLLGKEFWVHAVEGLAEWWWKLGLIGSGSAMVMDGNNDRGVAMMLWC
ncbi:hypothetical protein VNO77_25575 [Canavalia gladiata]|uniref:Uncharacterized protein n=1 Tax=Canavalia gladiata TaxID=3824 RepID=A0AAN9QDN2_CANGL